MRHVPEYTIDHSAEPRSTVVKGRLNPIAPVALLDHWRYMKAKNRPWFHVRYHSCSPVAPNEFHTLHYVICHTSDEVKGAKTYALPHESDDSERAPKIFAACLETSDSQFFPQNYDEVREVAFLLKNIQRRIGMRSLTRLDFLTYQPLGVKDLFDPDEDRPDLVGMDFKPLPVRETLRSKNLKRWAAFKKARDDRVVPAGG